MAHTRRAAATIGIAWILSGTLDIASALIYYPLTTPATPVRILQGIASGVLGSQAFSGGLATAALGLALHYLIALIWAAIFFAACLAIPALTTAPVGVGVGYGVVVWIVMNLIVVPLSRVGRPLPTLGQAAIAALFLVLFIGLPNAFVTGGYFRGTGRT